MTATATVTKGSYNGFDTLIAESDRLRVTVVPSVGAKVVSLFDKVAGKEWLAPGRRPLARPDPNRAWSEFDCGGWDECLPNIASDDNCLARDGRLYDHGDVWSVPWCAHVDPAGGIVTVVSGRAFTYRFSRRISLHEARLLVSYELMNSGTTPFTFSWAMHPLLDARDLSQILLPHDVATAADRGATSSEAPFDFEPWPAQVRGERPWTLDRRPPVGTSFARKLYTNRLRRARAAVVCGASRLDIEADTATLPYFGIWLNYKNWPDVDSTLDHIAIEPTTSNADVLRNAEQRSTAVRLAPGATRTWWVRVRSELIDISASISR